MKSSRRGRPLPAAPSHRGTPIGHRCPTGRQRLRIHDGLADHRVLQDAGGVRGRRAGRGRDQREAEDRRRRTRRRGIGERSRRVGGVERDADAFRRKRVHPQRMAVDRDPAVGAGRDRILRDADGVASPCKRVRDRRRGAGELDGNTGILRDVRAREDIEPFRRVVTLDRRAKRKLRGGVVLADLGVKRA